MNQKENSVILLLALAAALLLAAVVAFGQETKPVAAPVVIKIEPPKRVPGQVLETFKAKPVDACNDIPVR